MILSFDPSGNFNEGKGITGYALLDEATGKFTAYGEIDASEVLSAEEHWAKHLNLIDSLHFTSTELTVVCEDYMLYANRAASQINSRFETPKLIGLMQYHCWKSGIPFYLQTAVSVKRRWPNYLLEKKTYLTTKSYQKGDKTYEVCYIDDKKIVDHIVDAIRHAVHFYTFHVRNESPEDLPSQSRPAD